MPIRLQRFGNAPSSLQVIGNDRAGCMKCFMLLQQALQLGCAQHLAFAFDKIGSLLSKLQAWECELHREAAELALLKARLIEARRPKSQSPKEMTRP